MLRVVKEHENIVKLIDYQCLPSQKHAKTYEALVLMEYCPHGTLFEVIEENCKLGQAGIQCETELLKIVYDVSNGLRFLHDL